jgi:hypothetical protein
VRLKTVTMMKASLPNRRVYITTSKEINSTFGKGFIASIATVKTALRKAILTILRTAI